MNTLEAIYERRSIRKSKPDRVPGELIEKLLDSATKAPSAMNRQPWRFVVLEGSQKDRLVDLFQKKIAKLKKRSKRAGYAEVTAGNMKQAPVVILVFNSESRAKGLFKLFSTVLDVMHIQSIGAAIQNMVLTAQELGLGTLWVGHVFYAVKEIRKFVGKNEELIAALAIGYADEAPQPRPRNHWKELTHWM